MFQIVSDLHTEVAMNTGSRPSPFNYFNKTHAPTIILAGDIGSAPLLEDFLREVCDHYEDVIMVAGNHEFYGITVPEGLDLLGGYDSSISNFHFLNNETVWIDGVSIFGGTMWSNTPPSYHGVVMDKIGDFSHIRDWNINKHMSAFEQWYDAFNKADDKDVVISHFLPSFSSVPEKFKSMNDLNSYYATEMGYSMDGIKLWFHGHTHDNMDYKIGDSRIICNPYGYAREFKNGFDDSRVVRMPS